MQLVLIGLGKRAASQVLPAPSHASSSTSARVAANSASGASSKRAVALYEALREEGKLLVFELWEGESCCALDVAHAAGAGVYVATRCVDRGSHIGSPGFLLAFATCGWLQRQGAACWAVRKSNLRRVRSE